MTVTVCRNCQCRMSGELWHGPHCKCPRPDFVAVDTRFSIVEQLQGAKVGLVPPKEAK